MIIISFASKQEEVRGLGFLVGRFSFQTRKDGTSLVPENALIGLAREGIKFKVDGRATYEQTVSALRNSTAPRVQLGA